MKNKKPWYTRTRYILPLVFIFPPVGLTLLWTQLKWSIQAKWIVTGIMGVFFLGTIVSGMGTPSKTNQPTTTAAAQNYQQPTAQATSVPLTPTDTPIPTATPTPIPYDANGFPQDYQTVTVANLAKVPSAYDGKTIYFTCTVGSFAKNSSGDATAINCTDPNDFGSIVQIDASGWDLTKINQDDTIRVYGSGTGAASGQNAYGGTVTEATVMGLYINDITSGYNDAQ